MPQNPRAPDDKLTLAGSDSINSLLDMVFFTHEDNYPIHCHDFYELELVVSGKGINRINGKDFPIERGSVFFLTPSDFHEIIFFEPTLIYNISFSDNIISHSLLLDLYETASINSFNISDFKFEYFKTIFEKLNIENINKNEYSEHIIKFLINSLFAEIIRSKEFNNKISHISNEIVKMAILYIKNHFKENPNLTTISSYLGVNKNYFCKIFYDSVGKHYIDYLNNTKLHFAKKLLLNTDLSITEICFSAGFSSFSNFSRKFKTRYNISPTQLRKQSIAKS